MIELPKTLEEAIAQSREAVKAALNDGQTRLQVELVFPEIALQAQSITQQFITDFEELANGLKVFFPDTGAAALARRDWGTVPFKITDLGSSRSPIAEKIESEDQVFLLVNASSIEVAQVEQLCNAADSRPVILLNPRLEDAATIGIGYAGRQLRDRFLNTLQSCYYIRPLPTAALFRCYPQSWQVWLEETEGEYKLISETAQKPVGDDLERIIAPTVQNGDPSAPQSAPVKKKGMLAELQSLIRALTN
ncbi:DUF1995 family protein [Kamptonema animale CS-326]|jgi:hypothetical protein|uniref:DUF1995 family protein n=1 Tax=Kamptonema animale TaxID=92934 RepID=UPI00232A9FF9|nr:DUF1995 family protein [Kamptonema animale]MDB9515133.1 DUF1995 family protein [Kamptonema animale CS-326]